MERGIEYWHLANYLQRIYFLLTDVNVIDESNNNVLLSAFILRQEVYDRIEKYGWQGSNPIATPTIPGVNTLGEALRKVRIQLDKMSEKGNCNDEVESILNKEELFYLIQDQLGDYVKSLG
jgi:hypothetical protein